MTISRYEPQGPFKDHERLMIPLDDARLAATKALAR